MQRYSKSRIETFHSCKLKFKYQYIDMIDTKTTTDDSQFGSLIHKAFEIYNADDPDNWKKIVSLIKDYPLQSQEYRNLIPMVLRNMKRFFSKYGEFPAEVEKTIEYKDDSIHTYGVIDRLMVNEDQIYVVDYKTSRYVSTKYHTLQIKLYVWMLWKLFQFPPEKVRVVMYYPRPASFDYVQLTTPEIEEFEKELYAEIQKIETNTDWTPKSGKHCTWCAFNKTDKCPITKEA
jgi:CRISPR/Cas system-associated exonuclease Cas4 (RecB family)